MRLPAPAITLFAFVASLLTIALVMFVGNRARGRKIVGLILAGLMISALNNAGISFMKLMADPNNVLPEITYWLMGSLAKTRRSDVSFVAIPMALGLIPLFIFRWRINLLTLHEDEAQSMGVNVKATRALVIVCSTLITAAAVSVSGIIGWAGLVIPHLTRRLVGNDYRRLMPTVILFGALFLLLIDNVSRNLFATEVPLGILSSLAGAPFFLWLLTRKGELW
jgi:iron complex transport system permease protein